MTSELPIHSRGDQSFLIWPIGASSVWKVETHTGHHVATFETEGGAHRFIQTLPKIWGDYRCSSVRRAAS